MLSVEATDIIVTVLNDVIDNIKNLVIKILMNIYLEGEENEGGHSGEVRRLRRVILEGEEIEGGHFGEVRRLRGVIQAK